MMNEQNAHCRHVLDLLGVNLWAKTTTTIHSLPAVAFDRFNQKSSVGLDGLASVNQPSQPSDVVYDVMDGVNEADQSDKMEVLDWQEVATNISTKHDADISYEVEGIRAGKWVLIADVSTSSREERLVWMSLKSALSCWAKDCGCFFDFHRISYPMSDELSSTPTLAQICFDGFVLRLQMLEEFSEQVILLNDLNEYITHQSKIDKEIPTLAVITKDASRKKQLWQLITT
ncbi:hypothetical protein LU276_05390 [Moraxella haemolytica]|uniref:hypothetical protein n=1 Tax=Moraxella haemolytica TaxID=2904119 RepID=UPI00254350A4|nr:hypothetical protein [Moraxella sp. ZY171148]WII94476.1 hypothetical protein LU276_05390 [Moraxella sp. ZY171148]